MKFIDVTVPLDANLPSYPGNTPFGIEPIYAGLAVSLVVYATAWAARSRPRAIHGGTASPGIDS